MVGDIDIWYNLEIVFKNGCNIVKYVYYFEERDR